MAVLDTLGNFASNIKQLTLPGVVAAAGFVLLVWPPATTDFVPIPVDNHPVLSGRLKWPLVMPDPKTDPLSPFVYEGAPACEVSATPPKAYVGQPPPFAFDNGRGDRPGFVHLNQGRTVREMRQAAVDNQLILEDANWRFQRCIEEESAIDGVEDGAISNVDDIITKKGTERAAFFTQYQTYGPQQSPVSRVLKRQLDDVDGEIQYWQAVKLDYQEVKRERARRVAELTRLDQWIQGLLGEPGRLRPKQRFDDLLTAFSSHIVGLLTLVFAWSLLIDPVNRAIFSYAYDNRFDGMWDELRPGRVTNPDIVAVRKETKQSPVGPNYALRNLLMVLVAAVFVVLWLSASPRLKCDSAAVVPLMGASCEATSAHFWGMGGTSDSVIFVGCVLMTGLAFLFAYYLPQVFLNFRVVGSYETGNNNESEAAKKHVKKMKDDGGPEAVVNASALEADIKAREEQRKTSISGKARMLFLSQKPDPVVPLPKIPVTPPAPPSPDPETTARTSGAATTATTTSTTATTTTAEGHTTTTTTYDVATKVEKKADPTSKCPAKLKEQWAKLSQPEYAIGMQVITSDSYKALQGEFYSDSQVSAGMILPVLLLVWAALYTDFFAMPPGLLFIALGAAEVLLLLTAVDRRHKFNTASDNVIAGGFMAKCKAAEDANAGSPSDDVKKQIKAALDAATIVSPQKDLKILPGNPDTPVPASTTTTPSTPGKP